MAWIEKDPEEVLDYVLDWSAKLGEDTISTSAWSVPGGVSEDSSSAGDQSATIWISGGTTGTVYTLTNTIVTTGGRTLEQSLYLSVIERSAEGPSTVITKADLIALAHRKLSILSVDESVTTDQTAYAEDVLQGIWDEFSGVMDFSIENPGRRYYHALADMLAAELAPHYSVPGPRRSRALGRLRAILLPDDRPDKRDINEDGTVTEAERDALRRAEFY